ncbi:MAG: DMT family transporter [Clostridia bacterium]|nr:DMT family transporter [Clostridia bacterium]
MYKKTGFGEAALFGAALIWGTGFVAQSLGSDTLSPFTYNGVRNVIGSLTLLIFLRLFHKKRGGTPGWRQYLPILKGGAVCGFLLFCAANLQQISISWVDENGQKALVGKIGFLTSLYIVLVPVLGLLFGKKTRPMMWLGVLIALIGAYLLTDLSQGFSLGTADALALVCALMYAFQIIAIDHYAPGVDPVRLAFVQFSICGALSLVCGLLFEEPTLHDIYLTRWPLLYAGVLSSGVAYTLQVVGQKHCRPPLASLIMSLESVVSAVSGYLVLHEQLSLKQLAGCALMLGAVLLCELTPKGGKKANDTAA